MTPAAFALAKRMLDVKNTSKEERQMIRDALYEAHFFEVSKVIPLAQDLKTKLDASPRQWTLLEKFSFLPAPKTWIEFKDDIGRRWAFVMTDDPAAAGRVKYQIFAIKSDGTLIMNFKDWVKSWGEVVMPIMLILINTPRVIGRRQHMPHRGLERELVRNQKMIGKFPLRAWTEIKLEVSKPPEIDMGEPHEAHLTGQKCLHFCRAHLRIWDGGITFVSSHWRGDPALGIKQSRYAVV